MMRRAAFGMALVAALVAVDSAQAFPIGRQDYQATIPFGQGLAGSTGTILSGEVQAEFPAIPGPFVLLQTEGLAIDGIDKVCWSGARPDCAGPGVRLDVLDGAAIGLKFPTPVQVSLSSAHSLAFFLDLGDDLEFEGFSDPLLPSLAAVHVEGRMRLDAPHMPVTATHALAEHNAAGLLLLDDRSRIQVLEGSRVIHTLSGSTASLTFQGTPRVAPFGAGSTILPFTAGAKATLVPATPAAAQEGMDLARLDNLSSELSSSLGGNPKGGTMGDDLKSLQPLLGAVLAGALLALPDLQAMQAEGAPPADLASVVGQMTLLRFDSLTASASPDDTVELTGSGPLRIQAGRVVGAPSLLGLMPWWCWLLWTAAVGMWIARLAMKPPKENERWDRLRWVGWVAGPLVGAVVFWVWDAQVHSVFGLSLLRGGAGGAGTALSMLTVVLIGIIVYLAAALPLSSLLKSGARFAGQGNFMGLHRPVGLVLGLLLGATLLLSYVDLLIRMLG